MCSLLASHTPLKHPSNNVDDTYEDIERHE